MKNAKPLNATKKSQPSRAKNARKSSKRQTGGKISIKLQDAFDFLSKLEPGSVDLIVSSPPYFMGKEYDTSVKLSDFIHAHEKLAPLLTRALRDGGSLCWQVGHHVCKGEAVPLDAIVYPIFRAEPKLLLRNRIVWTFGHGVHANRRFSGRHETILWFTKGSSYHFNLDAIRVPQKYPGKRHYKGAKKGEFSGNPKGKNPSDVWEIPNVKANHIEKTDHPCQFPVALAQRLIRGLSPKKGLIVDPFMGSGTTAFAAAIEGRAFAGCDVEKRYVASARKRVAAAKNGTGKYRPIEKEIYQPTGNESVAKRPSHFVSTT